MLHYPDLLLRRVAGKDGAGMRLVFLTNNSCCKPELIAVQRRQLWQIELFFKWIQQHLRSKALFGAGETAMEAKIWIVIRTEVLVHIAA